MNPKIPLQTYFKYECKKDKLWQLSTIVEIIDRWKEDYDLIEEIRKSSKCICNDDIHWIYKLECPTQVYKEGYKFKRLYESLVHIVKIGKLNKYYLNSYDEYNLFRDNIKYIKEWEQRIKQKDIENDYLISDLRGVSLFVYDDYNNLKAIKPNIVDEFEFELLISPDAFFGVEKYLKLIEEEYIKKGKSFES